MKTNSFKQLEVLFDCKCMTEFEYSFIEDMRTKFDKGDSFTMKQLETIERIYKDRIE